ncbi:PEPxxWA-CTERM sorting domain-containing protein [Sphingomonas sp. JC676]|uniref:PEPxxWA-CTERM sorting domain-containing protein n=1 Tax=Sphingomonas sp. JC676 TaxID=2768065 RepID=UPI00223AB5E1|nr:PEPxxWA-CTERM sorting domain-containing protein [Sphingomonas sp. JC676]
MTRLFVLLGALFSLVSAVPASADPLRYTVTGASGVFASFMLDDHPTPDPLTLESYAFFLFDAPGTYADGSTTAGLSFYDDSALGGISIVTWNGLTIDLTGMALFTSSTATPALFAFGPTQFTEAGGATYTISAVAGVPEPASWAMLVLGTGMIGVGVRRRRAQAALI